MPLPFQRLLRTVCLGSIVAGLAVSACSVPQFEFPEEAPAGAGTAGMGSSGAAGTSNSGTAGTGNNGTSGTGPEVDHCQNGLLDEELGESDYDCGGACSPCEVGQQCGDVADCVEGLCSDGVCIAAGCVNGVQDDTESDIDCGGGSCNACITGKICGQESDCESGVCVEAKCLAPACDDQVKNGKETGQDCGGDCPGCGVDQPCVGADDCLSGECVAEVCGPECPDGFANCDKKNDNLCEVNTRIDELHCGSCDMPCDLPHATPECSAGECRVASCDEGYADCDNTPENGCEKNLKQDKLNCGECDKACPEINGAPFCAAGECQITCSPGFDDCDDKRSNGCEKDITGDTKNCGGCTKVCPDDAGTPFCKDGTCGQTVCPANFADCDGLPGNGCEVDLRIDAKNCGSCRTSCDVVDHGTGKCSAKVCQVATCDAGYANCTGGFDDGCETHITDDVANCGSCGKICDIDHATAKCDGGTCAIGTCSGTFRDCNSNPGDGCEINIASNTQNCGGCGAAGQNCATKYANASSVCSMSACTTPSCNNGFGDCTGGLGDGCETNTTNTPAHCGGCTLACATGASAHVSSNSCVNSQCDPECSTTYASCDNNKFNGCEVNKADDEGNCGGCGITCSTAASAHVSANTCTGSSCDPTCSGSYRSCDNNGQNGCEIDSANNASHCGGCGNVCSTAAAAHVSSNNCSGSNCQPACSGGYANCDSNGQNGCETPTTGDKNNCGGCDVVCGTQNASATSCGSSTCNPTCNANWGKCSNPQLGCTTDLTTTSNCGSCGNACNSGWWCDGGCKDHKDIVVVNPVPPVPSPTANSSNHAIGGWTGSGGGISELTLNHTLGTAKSGGVNNRMVIIGVAASEAFIATEHIAVTYDGVTLQNAVKKADSTNQSWAGIYYILDASLPNNAGTYQVKVTFETFNQWGHGGFDVVELKNVMQTAPLATGNSSAGDCSGNSSRSVSVNFSAVGSFAYGLMSARFGTSSSLTSTGQVETWDQYQPTPANHTAGAAYVNNVDTNRTFTWNVPSCYNTAGVAVAIKRLTAP